MADPVVFPTDFSEKSPLVGTDKVPVNGEREYTTIDAIASYVGDSVGGDAFIWRPEEPSPSGNVFAEWEDLAEAIAEKTGRVVISLEVIDHDEPPNFEVTAGAYPLACTDLVFEGVGPRSTIGVLDGVTITGATIRRLTFDNVRFEWRGQTSSLLGPITHTLFIDMYRGAVMGVDGNTVVAFDIDEAAQIHMRDPQCQIEGNNGSDYDLFKIANSCGIVVFAGMMTTISGDFARSSGTGPDDGAVIVYHDSNAGVTLPGSQANVGGTYNELDLSQFGAHGAAIAALQAADTSMGGAIAALEATVTPTATDENNASISWTTQKKIRHKHTAALTTYTFDANTTQWPVGESRAISQYSASVLGFQFAVPSGHKLNGTTNGVSGVLGAYAWDDGIPLFTVVVTREASDEWSWA